MTDGDEVEAIARELGWWWRDPHSRWSIQPDAGGFCVVDWDKPSPCPEWALPTPEALLLLHLARLGPTRERCPDCAKRGGPMEWATGGLWGTEPRGPLEKSYTNVGWRVAWVQVGDAARRLLLARPCPTCTGPAVPGSLDKRPNSPTFGDCMPTGRVTREHGWAERWLRARPQDETRSFATMSQAMVFAKEIPEADFRYRAQSTVAWTESGDPEACADLWVLADQLQDKTDPLGDVLALWLSGAPCDECDGHGAPLAATLYKYFEHAIAERWELTPDSASRVKADLCKMVCDAGFPARDIEVTVDLDRRSFQVDGMDDLADWSTCSCKGAGKAYAAQLIEASP